MSESRLLCCSFMPITQQERERQVMPDTEFLIEEASKLATAYLAANDDRSERVTRSLPAEELAQRMDLALPKAGKSAEELLASVKETLHYSVRTGHVGFSNQLFGDQDPVGLLGEWMTALLNTSMYTYEVAPVLTLMELELMTHMCGFIGWGKDEGEGVFAPGGSIANLMALLAARNLHYPHVKEHGLRGSDRPVLFVSAESHYSMDRAASVAGLGTAAVRKVAVDEIGRMSPVALEQEIEASIAAGEKPLFLCATASTTVAGAFDAIDELADIAERHGMWLHVDGACGGSVLLSEQHRALMKGVERSDSVTWNPHKMMGVPLACSALLMRERGRLEATNAMNADYLFHEGNDTRYDLGDRSLQCGRRVDSLKLWLSWRALGDEGHAKRIETLFGRANALREMLDEREGFERVREPDGCNTCFHYVPPALRDVEPSDERSEELGELAVEIREQLHGEGRILINYAPLDGVPVLRHVASNHRVTDEDLSFLLDEVERVGDQRAAGSEPKANFASSGSSRG